MNEFVRAIIPHSHNKGEFLALFAYKYCHWLPPGGKVEPGETPLEALIREIREELGVGIATAELFCDKLFDFGTRGIWRGYLYEAQLDGTPINIETNKHKRIEYVNFRLFHPEYHSNLEER